MKLLALVVIVICAACSVRCSDPDTVPSATGDGKTADDCSTQVIGRPRLVVFGESQSQGLETSVNGCLYSFAFVLADKWNMNILDQARGGSLLLEAGAQGPSQKTMIDSTFLLPTDTVFWMAGYNDCARHGSDLGYLSQFKTELLAEVKKLGAKAQTVYIGTPIKGYFYSQDPGSHALYVQAVIDVVAIAGLSNVALINMDDVFTPGLPDWQTDQAHLLPEAELSWANALFQDIK